jgi:hypothetical protein
MKYIVLMDISPTQGRILKAAPEGEPPTIVDAEELFAAPSEFLSVEERARILIGKGVIVPADAPEQIEVARVKLKQTEAEAERSLRTIAKKEH